MPLPVCAAITVDGVLDEPDWQNAQVYEAFITTEPLNLSPAKYRTVVKLLANPTGLYIGFVNYQPPSVRRIRRKFARDSALLADRDVIMIDFDGSGLSAYDFTVSLSNSRQDGVFNREKQYSRDWDGTWYSQTSEDDDAWYSEVHIPWTTVPMVDTDALYKSMAVYFSRVVFDESLRFAFPNAAFDRPTFLSDLHPIQVDNVKASTLDWFPYITYSNDLHPEDQDWKSGIDVVWRPHSSLQLTAAINPDFGQVESDDIDINFGPVETFFSEKRPFFTENQSLFNAQIPDGDRLIHTRRIGASTDVGNDNVSDIQLAAKLSVYGEKLDYGVFLVSEDDTSISKGRDYVATRIQGHFGDIAVGHTLTYVRRATLDREALVNAMDVDWRFSDHVRFTGQVLYSLIDQSPNAVNGDEDLDLNDGAGWLQWEYSPSDRWRQQLTLTHYGDEFEMNDFGFMKRNDFQELAGSTQLRIAKRPELARLRSTTDKLEYGVSQNADGDRHPAWINYIRTAVFNSTRELELTAKYQTAGYDDLITLGNGRYRTEPQKSFELIYKSPRGNDFSYEVAAIVDNKGTNEWSPRLMITPSHYVTDQLNLSAEFLHRRIGEWLLWDPDSTQLAIYDTKLYRVHLNADWYPSTRHEIRLKFQWVGIEARAKTGYLLRPDGNISPSAKPVEDFSLSDVALQLRYRYELAPLSDIYLVYTRGAVLEDNNADRGPRQLFSDGWSEVNTNSIVAKIRYRF